MSYRPLITERESLAAALMLALAAVGIVVSALTVVGMAVMAFTACRC